MAKRLNGYWHLRVHHQWLPLIKAMRKMGDKSASYKIPLKQFSVKYAKQIEERFNKTEDAKGSDWPEWSEQYARQTESRALGILSSDMFNTLTNAQRARLSLRDFSMIYGMRNADYAVAFNFGRDKKKGRGQGAIPKRGLMGWNRKMSLDVNELLADHQHKLMSRAMKQFGVAHSGG